MKKIIFFVLFLVMVSNLYSQVWKEPPLHRLTMEEYEMTLDFWAKKYPDLLTVERVGEAAEKMGIYLLKITNKKISDRDKQVALISSLHGGPERSGTGSILELTEWLLSDDNEAEEIRQKQLVLIMPIANPYGFFVTDRFGNSSHIDPYHANWKVSNWDLENIDKITYKNLDKVPEIKAYFNVVDKYMPEVHLDLHGTGLAEYTEEQRAKCNHLQYRGNIMFESTGLSYSNSVLRPWDWRITEAMVQAGKKAGFPSDRGEADAQRLQNIQGLGKTEKWFWSGRPMFYTAQYAYLKYHTMIGVLEVGWEASGVARTKGLLEIGNKPWVDEKESGYPVNKIYNRAGRYVTVWGRTAQERRESRVELWQRQNSITGAIIYPETEGRESFIVGFTEKGAQMFDHDFQIFISNLKKEESFNAAAIESFIKKGPEIRLGFGKYDETVLKKEYIQNGVGLRLRIPYADARIEELRLNGHLLKPDTEDGYETWVGDGYSQVQINIPPAKSSEMDIAVVTCEYSTKIKRNYGWEPPKEVMDKLKKQNTK